MRAPRAAERPWSDEVRGRVSLRFVVRGPRGYEADAWEASVSVNLDAGEDMRRLSAEIAAFLA